ncbi:hypothetical protein ASG29_04115 [Sphingomonas sp. Leaf412]|uniref:glycosyltransferase family 2 protein n=1 Tax=Sphingomonas sp. Leaf412 TaxID=1736370 RepID=UPI0006FC6FCF|nr:glycosyltransferase family 2 protein [Sphingomonas sp. Leaf412]KQT35291.1 hypothetical protein ASG29_04115 [Sphingomonas sp. Leaf412]
MAPVTVIVPAFDAAATIGETLASVCAQTHAALQVLVVDDGSRDDTAAIARAVAARDPRVTVLRRPNGGVARARNAALALATGDFVAPLDADDLWHPTKIARQLARLDATPAADLVYCWSVDIDAAGMVVERRLDVPRYEGDVIAPLIRANFIDNSSTPLIRRDALHRAGGWDPTLRDRGAQGCEDWLLYLRIAARGAFALEPAFLVGYRQSPAAMSRNVAAMRRSSEVVLAEGRCRHPALPDRLFRWARAAFGHYVADMLAADGRPVRAATARAGAIARDPAWLASRTARRRLRRRLAPATAVDAPAALSFGDLAPDPTFFFAPDPWSAHRDARLHAMRVHDRGRR